MINIIEGSTHLSGSMLDIESEMQSGLLCVVRAIRENEDDEQAILFMIETASLMKGYTEGINKGLTLEECNQLAIDELSKLAKE